jgi:hypothetical protein
MSEHLIQGQIEAIMPRYLAAREKEEAAKLAFSNIKEEMLSLIPTPQTISTVWGKIVRKKGSRRITINDKAVEAQIKVLEAQIKALKEQAVKNKKASEKNDKDQIVFYSN